MFRTAAIYIVGSWLVMQVADVLFPAMDIPERAIRYVLLAALAGFPAALVFGWFYDVSAQGIRRTRAAGPGELQASQPLGRSDYLLLTALLAVVAAILYNTIGSVVHTPAAVETAPRTQRSGPPVLAVLPFSTTSLESESAFFASGVHDDLLTQLSKLHSIRVISRTSVLEYQGKTRNLREIGNELGADVILEGGVQVAGDQIRINAQLIDSRSDEHLWAETYDRSLTAGNVFQVQADIARAITTAMSATLSEQENRQLSVVPTNNMAAYRLYRRAMDARTGHGATTQEQRAEMLEQAVELDPGFTRAWAELAGAYALLSFESSAAETIRKAEQALDRVASLAPESAEFFVAQAYHLYYIVKDYDHAHQVLNRAIALTPSDTSLLELRSWIERRQGDFDARLETIHSIVRLDPRNQDYHLAYVTELVATHRYDAALKAIGSLDPTNVIGQLYRAAIEVRGHRDFGRLLAEIEALEGRLQGLEYWWLFQAQVANHRYDDAMRTIGSIPELDWGSSTMTPREELSLWVLWLTGDRERLAELAPPIIERLESFRLEDGEFPIRAIYRWLALAKGALGESEDSLRLLRRFQLLNRDDWAGRMASTDTLCTLFAMNRAVSEAVACLREGLANPSYVMPFIDPWMPYYDAIRDTPEFVALLAELEGRPADQGSTTRSR